LRGFAAGALGSIGDAQSLDPLATALNDPDPGVRSLSAEALGRIGDALAVAPLAAALNDADASVRRSAAEALGKIGAPAAQALISALGDAGADVRRVAAEGLGGIRDGGAVDALIAALQDAAQPVRMAAATALGKTGDLRAFEPVLNLLVRANGARQTQEFCATNLALERMTGHQNARQIWEGCLDDWNAWWQQAREGDARAQQPEGFQQAYELGRKKCLSPRWWDPADFPGARAALQRSLALAETDEQRAAAHVALGDHWIQDPYPADPAAVRREYAAALALEGATTDQRAQATLGIGETYLREKQYDRARQEFARARGLRSRADWEATVQLALAWSFLQERKLAAARREFARLPGMDGADRIQKWEAQAHLQALRLAPRIRPDHPRLFFDAETWPAVKARALGPERAALAAMERRVAAVSESEIEVGDWGSQAMDAAFVYRVTGDLSAFEKARGMLRATVAHYLRRVDANAHSYSRVACAAALDWMWNDLTPAERRELARGLLQYAYSLYADDRIRGKVDGLAYYYERNIAWYAGLVTFNADLDDVDYARALSLLAWGYSHNKDEVNKYLQASGDDGAGRSALEYYFAETLNTFWQFLHCWRPALGQEVPDSVARFLSPDYILRNVVGVARGRFHHFGYGRSWRSARGMRADLLCDHLAQYVHFFSRSHPQESGMARFLRERMLEAGTVGEGAYSVYPFVLAPEEAPPAGIPRGLPIARHFEYVGQILMSSGFGPDDTYALFSCGGGQNEMDFDATHFTIYRNGYLALDTGSRAHDYQEGYGPRDVSGPNYAFQSVAHNCVLIRMEGEVLPHKTGRPLESNSGGQRKLPREAKLLAFETQPLYAYAATDATPTYHEGKCARMVRQLLFLPPNHFVVFDRVAAKKAEYPKTWLLHTANEPAISGKEFRADQNRGRLFCRTLYPPNAVLEKIGGPGKEFWSDGRNWPIPPDSAYLGSIGMEPGGEVPESIGRWRVEVKPGAARTDDLFLHLIQTADQTVEKMVESRVRDRGDRVELVFTANGRTYALALNKTGAVGGRLRITEGGTVLADRDLTQEVMPQAGLAISR
ncbi:MAG: HEAT repeat domain-containing protein, partial [Armatimonadetes bacterium]|nr:HEAT repeat domain-containing protein [Armatimonadota bacterium]